jgi:hypothetical protein
MSQQDTGIDRGAGRRFHHCPTLRTSLLVLMGLALLTVLIPADTNAEVRWQELWAEDFDHSMNDGWALQTYGVGDRVEVVAEGFEDPDRGPRRIPNNVLYGKSLNRRAGYGFSARTPSFKDLGLDEYAYAYTIDFRYKVLNSDFCWTLPLASPDLMLVISECTVGGDRARLGIVDQHFRNFRGITEITVGVWHDFSITVRPMGASDSRQISIYIDDVLVDQRMHTQRNSYDGVVFMDLPAFPVNTSSPDPLPDIPGAYFGSGYWDDIRIRALQEDRIDTGKPVRDVHVDPNPFNPATTIRMQLEAASSLDVVVFDLRGRRVRALHSGIHPAGPVELRWNGRDETGREVSSGVYMVRVMTPELSRVVRAVLVR